MLQFFLHVHCRVGSLENLSILLFVFYYVHCRVGSLESAENLQKFRVSVHCRVGSLEICFVLTLEIFSVHCRVGSLERYSTRLKIVAFCSLPSRQLRKPVGSADPCFVRSLPSRQLRNTRCRRQKCL